MNRNGVSLLKALVCFAAQRHNALRHKDTSQQAKHAILVAVCVLGGVARRLMPVRFLLPPSG